MSGVKELDGAKIGGAKWRGEPNGEEIEIGGAK